MFVEIDQAEVEAIKREVVRFLPVVKSSHRAEAVARGLGFGSNAALREAFASGGRHVRTDSARFEESLSKRGHLFRQDVRWTSALSELEIAILARSMRAVIAKYPDLNRNGCCSPGSASGKRATGRRGERPRSSPARRASSSCGMPV
ncbi:hypothetical protein [Muricoccus vinaceus]|uniref:Uncharacterized protein n=1 Tax=Muricoccus vinaceus TaxID=424704 RepID=A0ABV6IVJ6_9PROT